MIHFLMQTIMGGQPSKPTALHDWEEAIVDKLAAIFLDRPYTPAMLLQALPVNRLKDMEHVIVREMKEEPLCKHLLEQFLEEQRKYSTSDNFKAVEQAEQLVIAAETKFTQIPPTFCGHILVKALRVKLQEMKDLEPLATDILNLHNQIHAIAKELVANREKVPYFTAITSRGEIPGFSDNPYRRSKDEYRKLFQKLFLLSKSWDDGVDIEELINLMKRHKDIMRRFEALKPIIEDLQSQIENINPSKLSNDFAITTPYRFEGTYHKFSFDLF